MRSVRSGNLKRFIRYLYEYENGKRIRNVGFVKVEAGNDETTLHMQGKGFHESDDRKLALYLFYEENEKLVVFRQGEMNLTTPALSWHLVFSANDDVSFKDKVIKVLYYSKVCY